MFRTHHPSTQATSTQGKSIIHYNSTSMFIFYQPINFFINLNFILFIAQYPDCISGHVNILLIQIILYKSYRIQPNKYFNLIMFNETLIIYKFFKCYSSRCVNEYYVIGVSTV